MNKFYYKDGSISSEYYDSRIKILHRKDGPAVERANGHKEWWLHGRPHREDGPAVEYADGHREWYLNGMRHRKDGPAIEYTSGYKYWYVDDKLHREDGPAVEGVDGHREWYIDDGRLFILTKKHLIRYMKANNLTIAHLLTDSDEIVRVSVAKYDWSVK